MRPTEDHWLITQGIPHLCCKWVMTTTAARDVCTYDYIMKDCTFENCPLEKWRVENEPRTGTVQQL